MTERPTDYGDELLRGYVQDTGGGHVDLWIDRDVDYYPAKGTRVALVALPPAKERVPWWEAAGRKIDGHSIVRVEFVSGLDTATVYVTGDYVDAIGAYVTEAISADGVGMVEVDAR